MDTSNSEFENLYTLVKNYEGAISKSKKYVGNKHYFDKKKSLFIEINNSLKKINRIVKQDMLSFKSVESLILKLISDDGTNDDKLKIVDEIELKWQDLRLDLENFQAVQEKFKIPSNIPYTDIRLDLDEAMRNYQNGCFLSSMVMCRRAYEGALISKYKQVENKDPVKNTICKSCKNVVKANAYLGIVELHNWAVEKKIIPDKFKDIGFLVPNLGAGGAHPTESFPRDSEVADVAITTVIALLKQVYQN